MTDSNLLSADPPTLRSGVRFWTRRGGAFFLVGGMATWEASLWDIGEVREELNHIADAGFGFVRVALPWDVLQPDPMRLRTPLLDRLIMLLDSGAAAGIAVQLTVAGNLGGSWFVPRWVLPTEPMPDLLSPTVPVLSEGWEAPLPLKNLYEQEAMLKAQAWLWGELSRHLARHPAFGGLDIGFGGLLTLLPPRHPEFALRWWERVRDTHADHAPHWRYADSLAYFYQNGLPSMKAWRETVGDFSIALPVVGGLENGIAASHDIFFWLLLAQTLAEGAIGAAAVGIATSAASRHNTTPPLLGEGPAAMRLVTEEEQARAFADLLPRLHALGLPALCHAVWADAPKGLHTVPPYNRYAPLRHAGLLRADGREKEALGIWREFNSTTARSPLPAAPPRLPLDEAEWLQRRQEQGFLQNLKREATL